MKYKIRNRTEESCTVQSIVRKVSEQVDFGRNDGTCKHKFFTESVFYYICFCSRRAARDYAENTTGRRSENTRAIKRLIYFIYCYQHDYYNVTRDNANKSYDTEYYYNENAISIHPIFWIMSWRIEQYERSTPITAINIDI